MASPQIPLRNIWLLFLYAADLARFKGQLSVEAESASDLPELVARLLVQVVQQRLRRNLSRGYQARHAVLSRVRGRIDVLATVSGQLLEQGRVACRFEEHTMDTPRNRLVRAALGPPGQPREQACRGARVQSLVTTARAHGCFGTKTITSGHGHRPDQPQ